MTCHIATTALCDPPRAARTASTLLTTQGLEALFMETDPSPRRDGSSSSAEGAAGMGGGAAAAGAEESAADCT